MGELQDGVHPFLRLHPLVGGLADGPKPVKPYPLAGHLQVAFRGGGFQDQHRPGLLGGGLNEGAAFRGAHLLVGGEEDLEGGKPPPRGLGVAQGVEEGDDPPFMS